jgi:hypothetical protein
LRRQVCSAVVQNVNWTRQPAVQDRHRVTRALVLFCPHVTSHVDQCERPARLQSGDGHEDTKRSTDFG